MQENNIKQKVVSGLFWKFFERIGAQIITFIVSVVLARLLSPNDYGAISLVMVFITIANVFVSDGFGNALVQKKDANSCDFSSVFYFNIVFSWMIYFILFWASPFISEYYEMAVLCPVLRILALKIPLAGINSVQQAYVSRNMMFKRFFFSTIIGTVISAVVGIWMAYTGFGVWALVGQYMTNSLLDTIILGFTVKWKPTKEFSFTRLKKLLEFGWKILAANLIREGCNQLRSLIIGKKYSSEDLAFYTKGLQYPNLIITNVNSSVSAVLYPAMAKLQNNKSELKKYLKKSMSYSMFVVAPMMIGLIVIAEDLVVLMLTEKWIKSVRYLRLACVFLVFQPLTTANLQAINAVGHSEISLKLEIVKRVSAIILIILAIPHGVFAIAATDLIVTLIAIILNSYPNCKLLDFSFKEQFLAIVPNLIRALLMGMFLSVISIGLADVIPGRLVRICIEIFLGAMLYFAICFVSKCSEIKGICEKALKRRIKKKNY